MQAEVAELNDSKKLKPFKKGMTLDEYLSDMETVKDDDRSTGDLGDEDLYETTRRVRETVSKKLIPYEIRESDEDDYEESNDGQTLRKQKEQPATFARGMSNKKIELVTSDPGEKISQSNPKKFRIRNQSNSPFSHIKKDIEYSSPNKNLSRTLHSNGWKSRRESPGKTLLPSSTLYGKFLKGLKEKQVEEVRGILRQKQFKKKNSQDIEYVIKYERDRNSKYAQCPEIFDMRVEGVTDRLLERKHLQGRSIK